MNQDLGSSLIYFFYLHTTIRQKCIVLFHLFFLLFTTIRPKLGSSLIYFLYLYTTIRPNYIVLFSLFFLLCTTIWPKTRVLINLFILFVHNHSTKVRSHSYSLIYSFLHCADISFAKRNTSLISFALFLAVVPLYFVRYIHSSTTFMFPTLYSWKFCFYISYAISMAMWSPNLQNSW